MNASLKTLSNGVQIRLNAMLDRGKSMQAFLNTTVYRIYQNAQRERWMTENASEGTVWTRLNPTYADWKRKAYQNSPGGGTKMLIATGNLFKAAIGPGQGQRKVVTNSKLYISIGIPYAGDVDSIRSISTWGDGTRLRIKKAVRDFVFYNINRGGV